MFHEHLKRATGKIAAPNNLQASETHLLIYALRVLIHHLLFFVMYKACCSAITFIHAQHIRNAMSSAVQVVTECEQHSDIPDPFWGCRSQIPERLIPSWPLNMASLHPVIFPSHWDSSIHGVSAGVHIQCAYINIQKTQAALYSSLISSNAGLLLTFHPLVWSLD